jgi:hypothetical protein
MRSFSGRTRDFSFLDISKMSKIENLNVYRENYFKSLEENIYIKNQLKENGWDSTTSYGCR